MSMFSFTLLLWKQATNAETSFFLFDVSKDLAKLATVTCRSDKFVHHEIMKGVGWEQHFPCTIKQPRLWCLRQVTTLLCQVLSKRLYSCDCWRKARNDLYSKTMRNVKEHKSRPQATHRQMFVALLVKSVWAKKRWTTLEKSNDSFDDLAKCSTK